MKPNEIRAMIELRGEELNDVATAIDVSPSRLSDTINYRRLNENVRLRLARHLNLPVEFVFDQPLASGAGRRAQPV